MQLHDELEHSSYTVSIDASGSTQIFNAWGAMPQHHKDAVMVMVRPCIDDQEPS